MIEYDVNFTEVESESILACFIKYDKNFTLTEKSNGSDTLIKSNKGLFKGYEDLNCRRPCIFIQAIEAI